MSTTVTTIPAALAERDQWLLWRYAERGGKRTKVPFQAATPWREASPALSWSHHREVCHLTPAAQDAALELAEREGWPCEQLREANLEEAA